MMSDMGIGTQVWRLDTLLAQASQSDRLALWADAAQALFGVHRREQYLNRAFARNILRGKNGGWQFIGLSEDPQMVLTPAECQACDCLIFLDDTAVFFFEETAAAAAQLWCESFARESDVVQRIFIRSLNALLHRRKLFRFVRYFKYSDRSHISLKLLEEIAALSAAARAVPAETGRALI